MCETGAARTCSSIYRQHHDAVTHALERRQESSGHCACQLTSGWCVQSVAGGCAGSSCSHCYRTVADSAVSYSARGASQLARGMGSGAGAHGHGAYRTSRWPRRRIAHIARRLAGLTGHYRATCAGTKRPMGRRLGNIARAGGAALRLLATLACGVEGALLACQVSDQAVPSRIAGPTVLLVLGARARRCLRAGEVLLSGEVIHACGGPGEGWAVVHVDLC
jgi:hypothetical protein